MRTAQVIALLDFVVVDRQPEYIKQIKRELDQKRDEIREWNRIWAEKERTRRMPEIELLEIPKKVSL